MKIQEYINNLVKFCNENKEKELWPGGPNGEQYLSGMIRVDDEGNNRGSYVEGLTTFAKTVGFLNNLNFKEVFPGPPEKERGLCDPDAVSLFQDNKGKYPVWI